MAFAKKKPGNSGGKKQKGATASAGGKGKGPSWDDAVKANAANWKKGRAEKDTGGGGIPDVPDGTYVAKLTGADLKVFDAKPAKGKQPAKAAQPYIKLKFTILRGDSKGLVPSLLLTPFASPEQAAFSAKQFQRLGYETENVEPGELKALVAELIKTAPTVKIQVTNSEYQGKDRQTVYVNERLTDDDGDD